MLSLESAQALIVEKITPLSSEFVPLREGFGRVLRQEVLADTDLPSFDRSGMDGYALHAEDRSTEFTVTTSVRAGETPLLAIKPGECARIFTGAELPPGTNQVIMQELAEQNGSRVRFRERPLSAHVRRRGEDAVKGAPLIAPGSKIGPVEMGTLAMLGVSRPVVSRKVSVDHLTTGDELVEVDQIPQGAQIRDSNSLMVRAWLTDPAYEIIGQQRVVDELGAALAAAQSLLDRGGDILLISGGASVGDHDYTASLLERLGFIVHFRQLDLRPGKPLIFATRGSQIAFGIPGNPVSHLVCFELLIRFALEKLTGVISRPRWGTGHLADDFPYRPHPRETFWPAISSFRDGVTLQPLPWQSSGHLSGLISANALLRLPSQTGPFHRGQSLNFFLIQ